MEALRRRLQNNCLIHFCVEDSTENIPATASAVKEHKRASFISVPAGTALIDCIRRLRSVAGVGENAKIYGLDEDVGQWAEVLPEYLDHRLDANDEFYFKFLRELPNKCAACDLSEEWARAVLQPYPYSVLDLPGLRRALSEPLPLPLPIGDATFSKLNPEVASNFVSLSDYPAEAIACHTTTFMISKVTPGMSESLLQTVWDHAFCSLWMALLSLTSLVTIYFNWNVVDKSGASTASVRPDLMLWTLSRLCVTFEEKRDDLLKALKDLVKKIAVLPPQYFGPVQWIIGVGLARTGMSVWAMKHGQAPDDLSGYLNLQSEADKAKCLRLSVNFLRVALSLTSTYSKLTYLPAPFTSLEPCTYGSAEQITRRLSINYPVVVKSIEPWSEHVKEGFTTKEYVTRAYAASNASDQPGLVKGDLTSCRKPDHYKVVLKPVGFEQVISEESELRVAIRDVLRGLQVLHGAGLVHRDVRWKNVLITWSGYWMLIDLETVWECGQEPACVLRVWDAKTLVGGRFTVQSDLYLVAKLMLTLGSLSHAGNAFQSKLMNHGFANAGEALADSYVHL